MEGFNTMKILVCGGRNYSDEHSVYNFLDEIHKSRKVSLVIHGGATGADTFAGKWAKNLGIPTKVFLPDWNKFYKAAGPIRNKEMLSIGKPDLVVAFPGKVGSQNMRDQTIKAGVELVVFQQESEDEGDLK
jgi:hypothetical protein